MPISLYKWNVYLDATLLSTFSKGPLWCTRQNCSVVRTEALGKNGADSLAQDTELANRASTVKGAGSVAVKHCQRG